MHGRIFLTLGKSHHITKNICCVAMLLGLRHILLFPASLRSPIGNSQTSYILTVVRNRALIAVRIIDWLWFINCVTSKHPCDQMCIFCSHLLLLLILSFCLTYILFAKLLTLTLYFGCGCLWCPAFIT